MTSGLNASEKRKAAHPARTIRSPQPANPQRLCKPSRRFDPGALRSLTKPFAPGPPRSLRPSRRQNVRLARRGVDSLLRQLQVARRDKTPESMLLSPALSLMLARGE